MKQICIFMYNLLIGCRIDLKYLTLFTNYITFYNPFTLLTYLIK